MTQLVVEFAGLNIPAPDHDFLPRSQVVDLTKVWIDRCQVLGSPRIMVNQGQLTQDNKQLAVDTLALMVAYGKTRGVRVTMEARGSGAGRASAAAAPGASAPAPPPAPPSGPAWMLLHEVAKSAGAFINIDLGGVGAANQDDLHAALKVLLTNTAGTMHVRQSANWDLATALRYIESLGYTGIYSIEAPAHERTRAVYRHAAGDNLSAAARTRVYTRAHLEARMRLTTVAVSLGTAIAVVSAAARLAVSSVDVAARCGRAPTLRKPGGCSRGSRGTSTRRVCGGWNRTARARTGSAAIYH